MKPRAPVNRVVKKIKVEKTLEETLVWCYKKNRILPFIEALKAGADPNTRLKDGIPLLQLACARGDVCFIQALLEHNADPNIQTPSGETPLHASCRREELAISKLLLRHGADPRITDMSGLTPLCSACEYSGEVSRHMITELIEHGADINFRKKSEAGATMTPLKMACINGMFFTVCNLLAAGADPNIGHGGESPLHMAIGAYMDCTPLLAAGADVNASSPSGRTALSVACENGDIENVIRLIEHGALINKADDDGLSPLAYACWGLRRKTVEYLIEKGAQVNQPDLLSLTPAYYIYSDTVPALICGYAGHADHRDCDHAHEDQPTKKASILELLFAAGADLPYKSDLSPAQLCEIRREYMRSTRMSSTMLLLIAAREKNPDSPLYKDEFPRDMFRIVLRMADHLCRETDWEVYMSGG